MASDLDPDLIEQYIEQKDILRQKNRKPGKIWLRLGAMAACLALIVSAAVLVPMLQDRPVILTGKQEVLYGESWPGEEIKVTLMNPKFHYRTMVQANVIEVLPDEYYHPGTNLHYRIARLSVVESMRGKGLPDEILMQFRYYDADVFDDYDTFIFSLDQVGVENYMLINETTRAVTYFPHMFDVSDLGYSSTIAFKNGKVDTGFFDKTSRDVKGLRLEKFFLEMLEDPSAHSYPVGYDSTLEEAKATIRALAQEWDSQNSDGTYNSLDYVTTDDIFITEEQKQLMAYLEPSESSVFSQRISRHPDRVIASYTRLVNGFVTDEEITFNGYYAGLYGYDAENGNVHYSGSSYSKEDLANMPDLGEILANMDLSQMQPPNIEIEEDMQLVASIAMGIYRKAGDQIYGVVRVMWRYNRVRPDKTTQRVRDECYYLYDQEGNGSLVNMTQLEKIFDVGWHYIHDQFPYSELYQIVSK